MLPIASRPSFWLGIGLSLPLASLAVQAETLPGLRETKAMVGFIQGRIRQEAGVGVPSQELDRRLRQELSAVGLELGADQEVALGQSPLEIAQAIHAQRTEVDSKAVRPAASKQDSRETWSELKVEMDRLLAEAEALSQNQEESSGLPKSEAPPPLAPISALPASPKTKVVSGSVPTPPDVLRLRGLAKETQGVGSGTEDSLFGDPRVKSFRSFRGIASEITPKGGEPQALATKKLPDARVLPPPRSWAARPPEPPRSTPARASTPPVVAPSPAPSGPSSKRLEGILRGLVPMLKREAQGDFEYRIALTSTLENLGLALEVPESLKAGDSLATQARKLEGANPAKLEGDLDLALLVFE